jgi:CheY-like chemotaxis protein
MRPSRIANSGGRQAGVRPSVLVVDDHPDVLRQVSTFLTTDFDVVATATDGHQAIDIAQRLVPDLIVLDIFMPGFDGFQVAYRLQELGSPARIIFMTMHEGEEYATEAFRAGGRGFVRKTRLLVDLISALENVIEGRRFVPSLPSLLAIPDAGHAVQFHTYDQHFIDGVGILLNGALRRGDVVTLVATAAVRVGVAERLRVDGWNVGEAGAHGRYHAVDAAESLAQIMQADCPDAERLARSVAELERIRLATAVTPEPRLTLVGEIAVPLLLNGNTHAALEIERLWSDLTRGLPWLGVCCYPMSCFADLTGREEFQHVCAQHQAVSHTLRSSPRA